MQKISTEDWDLICFLEQFWRENKCFPSGAEITAGTKLNRTETAVALSKETVKRHLEVRGIDIHQEIPQLVEGKAADRRTGISKRLSDIQLATATTILNPVDRRPISEKLESLGVTPGQYHGWKKSSLFQKYMEGQAADLYGEYLPDIEKSLISKAVVGDFKSQKLVLEMTGKYKGPQHESQNDIKLLVLRLIEILQKHISDPELLRAIANDIQLVQQAQNETVVRGEVLGA